MAVKKTSGSGLHEMPSGIIHTADSLANGPRGTFVDRFGPPGDPQSKSSVAKNGDAMGIGKAPRLLTSMQSSRQRSNAKG